MITLSRSNELTPTFQEKSEEFIRRSLFIAHILSLQFLFAVHYGLCSVAVSCGYDTWFAVRLVMDYTASHFTWSILGLYSEIDQIHLSSEAQCVSHHLPLVDCHTGLQQYILNYKCDI